MRRRWKWSAVVRWLERGDDDGSRLDELSIPLGEADGKRGDAMSATESEGNPTGFSRFGFARSGRDALRGDELQSTTAPAGPNRRALTAWATLNREDLREGRPLHRVLLEHLSVSDQVPSPRGTTR